LGKSFAVFSSLGAKLSGRARQQPLHRARRPIGRRDRGVQIASLFERHRIKRVPIVRDGQVVGVVSQSNLIQALASTIGVSQSGGDTDRRIRDEILARLKQQDWTDFGSRNITVNGGTVHLWGLINSGAERRALTALVEGVPGVSRVRDEMFAIY
jgi:hypothetical protein